MQETSTKLTSGPDEFGQSGLFVEHVETGKELDQTFKAVAGHWYSSYRFEDRMRGDLLVGSLRSGERELWLLVRKDDEQKETVTGGAIVLPLTDSFIEIEYLWVNASERQKGYGKRFIQELQASLASRAKWLMFDLHDDKNQYKPEWACAHSLKMQLLNNRSAKVPDATNWERTINWGDAVFVYLPHDETKPTGTEKTEAIKQALKLSYLLEDVEIANG